MTDEFYIGYLPRMGRQGAARMKRIATALVLGGVAIAALLVSSMGGFSDAEFEFGVERPFEGVLEAGAVPILVVERPGTAWNTSGASSYLLVAFGKFGADDEVAGLSGRRVRLRGSLIFRDGQTMIEVASGSVEDLGDAPASPARPREEELGIQRFTGEIVDSKCFLGVMKPGNLKPHRACAVRCISGGVPPVLLVRDAQGNASYYLLVSSAGEAVNQEVLDRVAEPIRVEGRVVSRGGLRFLYADPETYSDAP